VPDVRGQVPEGREELRAERHGAGPHRELYCRFNALGVVVGQLHRGEGPHVVGDEVRALYAEGGKFWQANHGRLAAP
jgi:hypothetical protein